MTLRELGMLGLQQNGGGGPRSYPADGRFARLGGFVRPGQRQNHFSQGFVGESYPEQGASTENGRKPELEKHELSTAEERSDASTRGEDGGRRSRRASKSSHSRRESG